MHQGPGERNSDPTGEFPVGVQESLVKAWVRGGLLQGWGQEEKGTTEDEMAG